jgi:hypothetical protein
MILNANLKNRAFRRRTFGLAIATAIAGASFSASLPADAQQANSSGAATPVTAQTDCSTYRDPGVILEASKCEVLKGRALDAQGKALDTQGRVLDAQGRTLDAESQALDKVGACLEKLVAFKKVAPNEFKKFGRVTNENACALSGRIPKPTANAAPSIGG